MTQDPLRAVASAIVEAYEREGPAAKDQLIERIVDLARGRPVPSWEKVVEVARAASVFMSPRGQVVAASIFTDNDGIFFDRRGIHGDVKEPHLLDELERVMILEGIRWLAVKRLQRRQVPSPTLPPKPRPEPVSMLASDGSIELPASMRAALGLEPGKYVYFVTKDDGTFYVLSEAQMDAALGVK